MLFFIIGDEIREDFLTVSMSGPMRASVQSRPLWKISLDYLFIGARMKERIFLWMSVMQKLARSNYPNRYLTNLKFNYRLNQIKSGPNGPYSSKRKISLVKGMSLTRETPITSYQLDYVTRTNHKHRSLPLQILPISGPTKK